MYWRELGIEGKPVIIGPYSFVALSKGYDRKDLDNSCSDCSTHGAYSSGFSLQQHSLSH
ncbi:hypothetical protein [Paenibacillus sp. NPDC055715]